jgi:integrase
MTRTTTHHIDDEALEYRALTGHFSGRQRLPLTEHLMNCDRCQGRMLLAERLVTSISTLLSEKRGQAVLANSSARGCEKQPLYVFTCVLNPQWKERVEHSVALAQASAVDVKPNSSRVKSLSHRSIKATPGATFGEFVENHYKKGFLWATSRATERNYAFLLKRHVIPALGHRFIADIRFEDVQSLIREQVEAGYAVETARHTKNVISSVFKFAKSKDVYFRDPPTQSLKIPRRMPPQRHALTFDQCRRVLEALASPVREMALLSLTTSMNVAEISGLRWKRVNLTEAARTVDGELIPPYSLAVRETFYLGVFGPPKTANRVRFVPLSSEVVDSLRDVYARSKHQRPQDVVFASRAGTPIRANNIGKRYLRPLGKKLEMPWLTFHVFRNTHSTLGEEIGMRLSDRRAQMGHGSEWMTLRYTKSDLERRRADVQVISTGISSGV